MDLFYFFLFFAALFPTDAQTLLEKQTMTVRQKLTVTFLLQIPNGPFFFLSDNHSSCLPRVFEPLHSPTCVPECLSHWHVCVWVFWVFFARLSADSLLQQVFVVRFLGSMAVRCGKNQEVIYEAMRQVLAARAIHNIFRTTESHLMVTSSCLRSALPFNKTRTVTRATPKRGKYRA